MDPLKESIKDEDSYVRKTAAICIAKLYDVSPELIEEQGFLKLLDNLLNDGNAMVTINLEFIQKRLSLMPSVLSLWFRRRKDKIFYN